MDNVRKCIVDENVILNKSRPLLMTEREEPVTAA
jgi:hypothetical protein